MTEPSVRDPGQLYARGRADWAGGAPDLALQVASADYRAGMADGRSAAVDAELLAAQADPAQAPDYAAIVDYLTTHHPADDADELDRLGLKVDADAVALLTAALAGELPGAREVADWHLARAAYFAHRARTSGPYAAAVGDVIGDWQRAEMRHQSSAVIRFHEAD